MRFLSLWTWGQGQLKPLVLTAPFDQRIEGESQTEEVQQSVQQGIQRDECIQCTITATTQPAFKKNRPFWRQYSSKCSALTARRP